MSIGLVVKEGVLHVASLLKNPAAPGWVTLVLLSFLAIAVFWFIRRTRAQKNAVAWLGDQIRQFPDAPASPPELSMSILPQGRSELR
ncbi:hypothetical protein CNY89_09750 [Amaricoccus sp. HAR-UPW-R2A-40]|nr:hypothetical protein CNY89_09750 [Amaricoccus sp. HAR-UPW-R2A-40]